MTMKIMMFIMPLLFYKFAAGLALYFIIGTIWGLAERKIIKVETPPSEGGTGSPSTLPPKPGSPNGQPPEGSTPKTQGLLGRLRKAVQERMEELQRQADEQSKRQIRNDPTPGSPSSPGTPDQQPRRDDRRDKKKKRRK
jgi:membrane protein insertase Oxa1/YidC/SpoIIIJ